MAICDTCKIETDYTGHYNANGVFENYVRGIKWHNKYGIYICHKCWDTKRQCPKCKCWGLISKGGPQNPHEWICEYCIMNRKR